MASTFNFNVYHGNVLTLYQYEHNSRIIHIDGYHAVDGEMLFFILRTNDHKWDIPLCDGEFVVQDAYTQKVGEFRGSVCRCKATIDAEGRITILEYLDTQPPTFKVKIERRQKPERTTEVTDPALDLWFAKMNALYADIKQKLEDGELKGEKGDKGDRGDPGADGKDYTITPSDYDAIARRTSDIVKEDVYTKNEADDTFTTYNELNNAIDSVNRGMGYMYEGISNRITGERGQVDAEIAKTNEAIGKTNADLLLISDHVDDVDKSDKTLWELADGTVYERTEQVEEGHSEPPTGSAFMTIEEVHGKSEQDNPTPTPDNPSEIHSVESFDIIHTGINLCYEVISSANISSDGTIQKHESYNLFCAKVRKGETYRISSSVTSESAFYYGIYSDIPSIGMASITGRRSLSSDRSFESSDDGYVCIRVGASETVGFIERGNVEHEYSTYREVSHTFPYALRSVGSVHDSIEKVDGEWKLVQRVDVVHGNRFIYSREAKRWYINGLPVAEKWKQTTNYAPCMCNIATAVQTSSSAYGICRMGNTTNAHYAMIYGNGDEDMSGVVFLYNREPIIHDLTAEDVAFLKSLKYLPIEDNIFVTDQDSMDVPYLVEYATKKEGGSGGISDVQVNGASIVTDGVANVPYAGNGVAGVVSARNTDASTGVKIQMNSGLPVVVINPATEARIDSRTGNTPIVPANLDYAVHSVGDTAYEPKKGEWTLKGTITTENKDTGVNVDLIGCTEILLKGRIKGSGASQIRLNRLPVADAITATDRYFYIRLVETMGVIEPVVGRYRTYATTIEYVNGVVNPSVIYKNVSDITFADFSAPSNVVECNFEIYAR